MRCSSFGHEDGISGFRWRNAKTEEFVKSFRIRADARDVKRNVQCSPVLLYVDVGEYRRHMEPKCVSLLCAFVPRLSARPDCYIGRVSRDVIRWICEFMRSKPKCVGRCPKVPFTFPRERIPTSMLFRTQFPSYLGLRDRLIDCLRTVCFKISSELTLLDMDNVGECYNAAVSRLRKKDNHAHARVLKWLILSAIDVTGRIAEPVVWSIYACALHGSSRPRDVAIRTSDLYSDLRVILGETQAMDVRDITHAVLYSCEVLWFRERDVAQRMVGYDEQMRSIRRQIDDIGPKITSLDSSIEWLMTTNPPNGELANIAREASDARKRASSELLRMSLDVVKLRSQATEDLESFATIPIGSYEKKADIIVRLCRDAGLELSSPITMPCIGKKRIGRPPTSHPAAKRRKQNQMHCALFF